MQSVKQQTQSSNNYLDRVLVYGAKPFLYRGRVRSLLGFPAWVGGDVAFPPLLPPVGFRYANANHTSMAYSREKQSIDIPGISDRNISYPFISNPEKSRGVEKVKDCVPETEAILQCSEAKPVVHNIGAGKGKINPTIGKEEATKIENRFRERMEKTVNPVTIPGLRELQDVDKVKESVPETEAILQYSEAKPVVHDIGAGKGKITPRSGKEEVTKTENRFREKMEKTVNPVTINGSKGFQNQFQGKREESIDQPSISVFGSKKSQNPEGIKNKAFNPQLMSKIKKSQEPGIVKEKAIETQLSDHREEPVKGDVKIINDKEKIKAKPDYEFGSQSYWSSAARVEQLRRQVLRLNTLKPLKTKILSSSPGEKVKGTQGIKKEEQLQIPDSPVPPVVIVKPAQRRTPGIPCAFWERSYLARFHLKTLR